MSPELERELVDALVAFGWRSEEDFNALSVDAALAYSNTPEEATRVLDGLRDRGLIRTEIEPSGELPVGRPMPVARSRWVRAIQN